MECPTPLETNGKITTEDIIQHLMQNEEVYFKSQQIGEEDLSLSEKETIAKSILDRNKCNFLSRFGKYLKLEHMDYFKQFLTNDKEENAENDLINYHYHNLVRYHTKSAHAIDVRNRRFQALKKLIAEDSYFSEKEMMKRNPLLYDQLIGKYLTEDEIKARDSVKYNKEVTFVNILMEGIERGIAENKKKAQKLVEEEMYDEDDSNSAAGLSPHRNGPFAKIEFKKLSLSRNEDEEEEEEEEEEEDDEAEEEAKEAMEEDSRQEEDSTTLLQVAESAAATPMETAEPEPETSTSKRFVAFRISPKKLEKPKKPLLGHVSHREDVRSKTKRSHHKLCKKWGEYEALADVQIHPWKRKETQYPQNKLENVAISIQERNILRDEFVSLMYQSFLDGKDDFDYSTVDINEEYDNTELVEQDAEEKYFESESPNEEIDTSAAGALDAPTKGNMDTNSSEDELDVFMECLNRHPTICQLSQDMKNL